MGGIEPQWMVTARSLIGTREVPGPANNPKILGWANWLGGKALGIAYSADSIPWCGLFAAYCVARAGLKPPKIAVRARAWETWEARLQQHVVSPGAILVFVRDGGGHVGFYVGEDDTRFFVLGGNQGDAVSIVPILKSRCTAIRWPRGVPVIGVPRRMTMAAALSTNEA